MLEVGIDKDGKKIDGSTKKFNFERIVHRIDSDNLIHKTIELNGIKVRFEDIKYNDKSGLWILRIMRERENNIPLKLKENYAAEAIELADDEYIGEDISMLYDCKSGITMIQKNRFSLGISRIEELLWKLNDNKDAIIEIAPILSDKNYDFSTERCKVLEISFANLYELQKMHKKKYAFLELINSLYSYGGVSGKITISVGRDKSKTLNNKLVQETVDSLETCKKYIRSAKIKLEKEDGSGDDENGVEVVDLFENNAHEIIAFYLEGKEIVNFDVMMQEIIIRFNKKKTFLYNLIGIKE